MSSPRNPGWDAREQAIDLGRQVHNCDKHGDAWCSCKVAEYLDLLLAATRDEPCPTCGGRGHAVELPPGAGGLSGDDPADYPCPANCIDGRVSGGPLVILGPEQVGERNKRTGGLHRTPAVGYPSCYLDTIAYDLEPVYRAPETGENL